MTLRRKLVYISFVGMALILLVLLFVIIKYLGTEASEVSGRGKVVWQTSIKEDINNDGKKEQLILTVYDNLSVKTSYLEIFEGIYNKKELELTGFEDDLAFCPQKYIVSEAGTTICIFGEVGVHSQNVQFIDYSSFRPIPIVSAEGDIFYNISCDLPNFDVSLDKDRIVAYFDNRNYDKNPLIDIVRSYYYLNNSRLENFRSDQIVLSGSIK